MIPWIQVYSNLLQHPKTYALADELKLGSKDVTANAVAAGMMISLWCWSAVNATDGILGRCSDRAIAEAAGYKKNPTTLVTALIKTGWLDGDKKIHDWDEYATLLMDIAENQKKKTNARVQKHRDKKKRICNVTDTQGNVPTIPNHTIPNHNVTQSGNKPMLPGAAAEAPAEGKCFTLFWEAYPVNIGRENAWDAWKELNPSAATVSQIMDALEKWKTSERWVEDGGRYIPRAAKFLAEGHWRNPPAPAKQPIPKGASGELGSAELEAIRRAMSVQPEEQYGK